MRKNKHLYPIRNWSQYNSTLVNRGSISLWFDQASIKSWLNHSKSGLRGKPRTYSDACVECLLVIKAVSHIPQHATKGLVCSLMHFLGLDLPAPHPTILSRRAASLEVVLPRQSKGDALHAVFDSTGLKVFGEGEWKVRAHGYQKRRTWRKLHLGIDGQTGEVIAQVATTNNVSDEEVLPDLLEQIEEPISQVTTGGGYDYATCYEAIAERKARAVIPPRRTGRLNPQDERFRQRDKNLRLIRKVGRKRWKKRVKYHRRSLVDTAIMRVKSIFGDRISARTFQNQATEKFVRCGALNRMTHLGMPESYRI